MHISFYYTFVYLWSYQCREWKDSHFHLISSLRSLQSPLHSSDAVFIMTPRYSAIYSLPCILQRKGHARLPKCHCKGELINCMVPPFQSITTHLPFSILIILHYNGFGNMCTYFRISNFFQFLFLCTVFDWNMGGSTQTVHQHAQHIVTILTTQIYSSISATTSNIKLFEY